MSEALVVALKIIAMFMVISVGYWSWRKGLLDGRTTPVLSRFVTDITLPALIFLQMVETVETASLRVGWTIPLLAVGGTCLGFLTGWATWRIFATRPQAPVFIFTSGMSNWVYLPLPIVFSLYGKDGLQTLFLCNLGLQTLFWSLGVAILHGGRLDSKALKHLITNPGLIATIAGIAFALFHGATGDTLSNLAAHEPFCSAVEVFVDSLRLLGQATIPVSLIVTGAQIASATMLQKRPTKALSGIALNRLILAPLLGIAMLWLFNFYFPVLSAAQINVLAIVLLMPVSVTSTVITDRMNQDTALAAQAVLYTTLASIVAVPTMFILARVILGG